jgi:hypothetical protein
MKRIKLIVIIIMLLATVGLSKSIAQTDVLISQSSSVTYTSLNAIQQARYDTIAATLSTGGTSGSSIYFINIASLSADPSNNGTYQIVMPFLQYDSVLLNSSYVQYTSDSNYSWTGNIVDYSPYDSAYYTGSTGGTSGSGTTGGGTAGSDTTAYIDTENGSLILYANNGAIMGDLVYGQDNYVISDLSGGVQVLFKNTAQRAGATCSGGIDITNPDKTEQPAQASGSSGCSPISALKILFVFTPNGWTYASHNWGGGFSDVAYSLLNDLHLVTSNTGVIQNWNVGYALAGAYRDYDVLPSGENQNNLAGDLSTFVTYAVTNNLRATYSADLVILCTEGDYKDPYTNAIGSSGLPIGIGPGFNNAYAIVEMQHAFDMHGFAHQVGHLMGGRHQTGSGYGTDNTTDCSHGFNADIGFLIYWEQAPFWDVNVLRLSDAMAIPEAANDVLTFVPYYANTNVDYYAHGRYQAMGNYCPNDAAATLSNNWSTISGYYTEPGAAFNIQIGADIPDCTPGDADVNVTINCGSGSYTIQWEIGYDGVHWTSFGTGASIESIISIAQRYYRVTVTDNGTGDILTSSFLYIPSLPCHEGSGSGHHIVRKENTNITDNLTDVISIYPNPNNGSFTLNIKSSIQDNANYEIINIVGQQLYSENISLNKGQNMFEFAKNKLAAGYYMVRIKGSSINQNIPLIIE